MKLFKSFKCISDGNTHVEHLFESKSNYLAHTHQQKPDESLQEHISKVKNYFLRLVEINGLEPVIDRLIEKINFGDIQIGNEVKTMFLNAIVFHDFGKVNPNFQAQRMQNTLFESDNGIKIGYEHSFASAYIFLNYYFDSIQRMEVSQTNKSILWSYAFLFSIPIIKHHSGYLSKDYDFKEEKIASIHNLVRELGKDIPFEFSNHFFKNENRLWDYFDDYIKDKNFDFFPIFAILKVNYSLLTASDYLATADYMSDMKWQSEEDFGLITADLRKKLIKNFDNNEDKDFNGKLILNADQYLTKKLEGLQEKSYSNLNIIRQKLGAEVLVNIETYKNDKVFYIEAPTGGGKTNMSMIAIRKLLEMHPEINKVFYVFPFTTLITQTAKAIKETFQLDEYDIAQVHSKAGAQEKKYEAEKDAQYGSMKRNQIDNLFVNYPFTLMTHIKFFDILKSNKKDTNYLLHRLANSIVIIDELQAYNPAHWDKIKYFIANYAELFNIRFIIMSATLPKIDEIELSGYRPKKWVPLIPNAKKYLRNPNFSGRVEINTDLLSSQIELEDIAVHVFEKSKWFSENRTDEYRGSVYTIIEFIFKKSASEFYEIVSKMEEFFDKIFVLSGTILEPRRRYIIEYLKDMGNRKKKILLITTQVVEAGVDIDMDLGFKNQSLIDSDEQLAGRINRNIRKQNCKLYLFKHDRPKIIYGNDLRYKETQKFKPEKIKEILKNKSFEALYKKVFASIFKTNSSAYEKGFNEYREHFIHMDFKSIHQDFKLIDSNTVTIFIPLDIPIECYKDEKNFSVEEIDFIKRNNCLSGDGEVSGEKIWYFYISLIKSKDLDFAIKNREIKILNGIMSKFVFSVFINNVKDLYGFIENLPEEHENQYQKYLKFKKKLLSDIYTLNGGLNEQYLNQITGATYEFI